jgi:hypothetical protein
MAHFAELDENNIVKQVIVVANEELLLDGVETEARGVIFCKSLFGEDTKWKQTSYNGNIRKNYAGIGYDYDASRDAFIAPQPYPSWILNEDTCRWDAPVPYPIVDPENPKLYSWDEATTSWVEVELN